MPAEVQAAADQGPEVSAQVHHPRLLPSGKKGPPRILTLAAIVRELSHGWAEQWEHPGCRVRDRQSPKDNE